MYNCHNNKNNNNNNNNKKKKKKKKKKEQVFSPLPQPCILRVDVIPLNTGNICIIGTVCDVFDEAFIWSNRLKRTNQQQQQ